jgi:putative chitinase
MLFKPLLSAMEQWEIESVLQQAHFLAQIAHESGSLRWLEEIWGPTPQQLTYEGRRDLGNTQPGDGKKYKGHGLIMITGRDNTTEVAQALEMPEIIENPKLLTQPVPACRSAAWFWASRKWKVGVDLNRLANRDDLIGITRVINGGLNGLEDRARYLQIAKQVFQLVPERQRVLLLRTPMMRGSDVEEVQRALNRVHPSDPVEVDGWYGPQTEAAVRWFQESQGLIVDGIAGPETVRWLLSPNPTLVHK